MQVEKHLDHSIMYIFAVALEDGDWHHVKSYTKQELIEKVLLKFGNQLQLMKIKNGLKNIMILIQRNKSFGAKVVVTLNNGKKITEQLR